MQGNANEAAHKKRRANGSGCTTLQTKNRLFGAETCRRVEGAAAAAKGVFYLGAVGRRFSIGASPLCAAFAAGASSSKCILLLPF